MGANPHEMASERYNNKPDPQKTMDDVAILKKETRCCRFVIRDINACIGRVSLHVHTFSLQPLGCSLLFLALLALLFLILELLNVLKLALLFLQLVLLQNGRRHMQG